MQIVLSQQMLDSITKLVSHSRLKCELLNVYQAATAIQQLHLKDNVALEDIVNEILLRVGPNTAISFIPSEHAVMAKGYMEYIEIAKDQEVSQPLSFIQVAI